MTTAHKANSGEDSQTPVVILNGENLPDGYGIPYFAGEQETDFDQMTR